MCWDETTTDTVPADPDASEDDRAAEGSGAKAMLAAVRAAGYEPSPVLRRREDHVEVIASRGGHDFALHLEFDGRVRMVMPVARAPATDSGT